MEKKFNYKLYKAILSLTQENLHISLLKFLEKSYGKNRVVEHEDNFIYAVGDIPICLVAHLDTVHKQLPQQIFYDKEEQVIWSPQGSGHDDRAGVYSIMELVKRGLRPHVLFTWNEEVGGIGATEAAQLLTGEGIDFCIELDRRGEKDSVYYDCDNPDFEDFINSFGFETAIGSFSDISLVCPTWGCAGVNLSIGYQNEHTPQEILYVDWMMNTIDKVEQILLSKDYDKEKFKYIENKSNYWSNFDWSKWGFDTNSKDDEPANDLVYTDYVYEKDVVCDECFNFVPGYKIIQVEDKRICEECYSNLYNYCYICGNIYKEEECPCLTGKVEIYV